MSETVSHRRMAENEVVFRQYNERVRQNFDEIVKEAKQSGQEYLIPEDDTPLHFYCECSDENCRNRIQMKPSLYNEIHQNRSRFIILNGHETNKIEQIVKKEDGYSVVEKYVKPPETARSLSPTGINH